MNFKRRYRDQNDVNRFEENVRCADLFAITYNEINRSFYFNCTVVLSALILLDLSKRFSDKSDIIVNIHSSSKFDVFE